MSRFATLDSIKKSAEKCVRMQWGVEGREVGAFILSDVPRRVSCRPLLKSASVSSPNPMPQARAGRGRRRRRRGGGGGRAGPE